MVGNGRTCESLGNLSLTPGVDSHAHSLWNLSSCQKIPGHTKPVSRLTTGSLLGQQPPTPLDKNRREGGRRIYAG